MTSEGTGKRRWLPSRHAMVPLAALGLILSIPLYRLFSNMRARSVLERELDEIRAKGEPASLGELGVGDVPEGENGAPLYARAFALIRKNEAAEPQNWMDVLFEPEKPFDEVSGDLETVLQLHAKAMELARGAAAKPRCVFDLDYTEGAHLALPHLAQLRHLSRLFAGEAHLHAHSGRPEKALGSLVRVLELIHALDEEALLISKIVQVSIVGIGIEALKRTQRVAPLSTEGCSEIIARLRAIDFARAATHGMMGERLFLLQDFDPIGTGSRSLSWGKRIERWSVRSSIRLSTRERVQILRLMTEIIKATHLPPWEARLKIQELYKKVWELLPWTEHIGLVLDDEPWKRYYAVFVRALSRRDAAVIGLACELYRSRHGRYPANLAALAPEFLDKLPPDPFTGKPFVYRRKGEGDAASFIVYSVGENLTDDGGFDKRSSGKDDMAWKGGPGAGTR